MTPRMALLGLCLVTGIGCSPPGQPAQTAKEKSDTPPAPIERVTVFKDHPGGVVYVANSGADTLTMFDRSSLERVSTTVKTGHAPGSVALGPHGRLFFPARWMDPDELSKTTPEGGIEDGFRRMSFWAIDPGQGNIIVQKSYAGNPDDELDPVFLTITPDGGWAAISDQGTNQVHFRDLGDEERKRNMDIATGTGPLGSAFSPDGRFFAVANNDPEGAVAEDTVTLVDFLGNDAGPVVLAEIPVGNSPSQVVASPDNTKFFVTVTGDNKVVTIDIASRAVAGEWAVPGSPTGIARDLAGARYYVALADTGQVVKIDGATGEVTGTVAVGKDPWQFAVDENGDRLWVTNRGDDTVSVIKMGEFSLEKNLQSGKAPTGIAILAATTTPNPAAAPSITTTNPVTGEAQDLNITAVTGAVPEGGTPATPETAPDTDSD